MVRNPLSGLFCSKKGEEDTIIGPLEMIDIIKFLIIFGIIVIIITGILKTLK